MKKRLIASVTCLSLLLVMLLGSTMAWFTDTTDVAHNTMVVGNVEIEQYEEEDDLTRIGAVIYCERKSHKGMIIGKGGRKLKGIGKSARQEIEALLGTKVFLQTWVKVRENWRDSDIALTNFGYRD